MPPGNPAGYLPGARGSAGRSSVRKDPAAEQGKVEATMAARPRLNANRRRPQVQSVSGGGVSAPAAPKPAWQQLQEMGIGRQGSAAANRAALAGAQGDMNQARVMPMPISVSGPGMAQDPMRSLAGMGGDAAEIDPSSFSTPSGPPGGYPGMMKPGPGIPPGGGPGGPMGPTIGQGLPPEIMARLQALQRPGAPGPGGGPPPGAGMMKPMGPTGPPAGGPPGMYGDVPPGLPAYFGGGGMPPGGGPFNPY